MSMIRPPSFIFLGGRLNPDECGANVDGHFPERYWQFDASAANGRTLT
jgi:hypothetical protein